MRPNLPFELPNEHACLALFHAEKNAWQLVTSTHRYEEVHAWKEAIKATGGTLEDHRVAAAYVRSPGSWPDLQATMRAQTKKGFDVVVGSMNDISAGGTRWLRSDPSLWWEMQSASVAQLEVIQACPQRSELVLGALSRQGHLGNTQCTPRRRGPSFVERRWTAMFPAEMAFVNQCQSLGLGGHDALSLWRSSHMKEGLLVESRELGELLNVPDLLDLR